MANNRVKLLVAFGTRPEAIKMAPLIKQLELRSDRFDTIVCVTAQHREMLDQILNLFEIDPKHDLDLMRFNQTLSDLTSRVISEMTKVMEQESPDLVIVQGDTTTTFVSSLAAYYLKIPVAHVEAGLRTNNKQSPFPEEINRRLTTVLADFHFAPTKEAKRNLIREGILKSSIFVTGNTVIDALKWVIKKQNEKLDIEKWNKMFLSQYKISLSNEKRTILVTGHRRENFGENFESICNALFILAKNNPDVQIIYPVHLNPNVQEPVYSILSNVRNIFLISPLDYEPFVFLMNKSHIVVTDSGGMQEEAPSLGIPVLVMRDTTERPEGVKAGTCKLVGTDCDKIVAATERLLHDKSEHTKMARSINPYGNGYAAKNIIDIIVTHVFLKVTC